MESGRGFSSDRSTSRAHRAEERGDSPPRLRNTHKAESQEGNNYISEMTGVSSPFVQGVSGSGRATPDIQGAQASPRPRPHRISELVLKRRQTFEVSQDQGRMDASAIKPRS
jgi:hypothetical protein